MKKILSFALAMLLALSLTACGGSSSSGGDSSGSSSSGGDSQQTYNLKFSIEGSEGLWQSVLWREWANMITEKTDGRVTFQFYYDSTLLDPNGEYAQLKAGVADIADMHKYASDGFKILEKWKGLTLGTPIPAQVEMTKTLFSEFDELQKEVSEVKVLADAFDGGTYQLLTVNKEVHSVDDMKGLVIWCEADFNDFFTALGATPVNTPWSEVYSSLQKNMYDGLMIAAETLQSCNFAEVCKYITMIDFCYMSGPGHLMNMNTWNSLPEDLQAIITDPELIAKLEAANHDDGFNLEESSIAWAQEKYGTTVVEPTDEARQQFLDLLTQAKGTLAKKLDDQGLPGTEMVATVAEWSAQ